MSDFPFGMSSDIELSFKMEGAATQVLSDIRRLRESGTKKEASIAVLVKTGGGRHLEPFLLPPIIGGDASGAMESLDTLVGQSRVPVETERKLDDLIKELIERTR